MIAAVQPRGELTVLGAVAVDVRIEQQQGVPPDRDLPDAGDDGTRSRLDLEDERFAIAQRRLNGQQLAVDVEIILVLPPFVIEPLTEVSLVVVQADADQRDAEIRRALEVIACQDTEAT